MITELEKLKNAYRSASEDEKKVILEQISSFFESEDKKVREDVCRAHTPDEIEAEIKRLAALPAPKPIPELEAYWKTRAHPPIPMVDTQWMTDANGVPNDVWLRCRKHGAYPTGDPRYLSATVTGSFVPVVQGISPWTTVTEGWKDKKGIWSPPAKTNQKQLENGHLLERNAAHWFGKLTGYTVVDDTIMYQSSVRPWALADTDRLYYNTSLKKWGVLECKSTTFHTATEHWEPGIYLLGKAEHAKGRFPAYYESQLRFYMWLMDMDIGCFVCIWGSNPDTDLTIVEIERDYEYEEEMLRELDAFIESLKGEIPPSVLRNDPNVAAEGIKRLYPVSNPDAAEVTFNSSFGEYCDTYLACSEQIKALEDKKKVVALRIQEVMADAGTGAVPIDEDSFFSISWKTQNAKSSVDLKRMKEELTEEDYDKYVAPFVTANTSRPFKITKKHIKK